MCPAPESSLQDEARAIWDAGLAAVSADRVHTAVHAVLTARQGGSITLDSTRPVTVVGAGKAAASMARAVVDALGARVRGGVVITPDGHGLETHPVHCLEAGHPIPDARGLRAAAQVHEMVQSLGTSDQLLALWSGGGSALLADPVPALGLDGLQRKTRDWLRGGVPIHTINRERTAQATLKGGRLGRLAAPADVFTLVLSDVPGDDPAMVASGPSFGTGPTVIIGRLKDAVDAAEVEATRRGWPVTRLPDLAGEARERGREIATLLLATAGPVCVLAGGEPTVTLSGTGRGGRCQELCLAAAEVLAGHPEVALLAVGTDGTDGPTDAAGAVVHGGTAAYGDPTLTQALAQNNSYPWLRAAGALVHTGPTRTNVTDLLVGLRR